jgi:hypothetical protein
MDNKCVMLLVLLDLSAAFDSVDHIILSQRLHGCGIIGDVHKWIMSYLHDRKQMVSLSDVSSPVTDVQFGVPQGSVLGPLLFIVYLTGLRDVIAPFSVEYVLYADDLQLMVTTSAAQFPNTVLRLQECICAVKAWLATSLLSLNPSKSEFTIFGTASLLQKCQLSQLVVGNEFIPFSPKVRDLGITLDSSLDLRAHIAGVCSKSFMRLRLVNRLRKIVPSHHYSMLVNSLVLSNLEFCSSIYFGVNKRELLRLQSILNASLKSIHGLRKYDHLGVLRRQSNWLNMEQRILFRTACITYIALTRNAPQYIKQLLSKKESARQLRSSQMNLLTSPRVNSVIGSRSFHISAPSFWNTLPLTIRESDSLTRFKSSLHRYLLQTSSV